MKIEKKKGQVNRNYRILKININIHNYYSRTTYFTKKDREGGGKEKSALYIFT
jgi:hypothetical protein